MRGQIPSSAKIVYRKYSDSRKNAHNPNIVFSAGHTISKQPEPNASSFSVRRFHFRFRLSLLETMFTHFTARSSFILTRHPKTFATVIRNYRPRYTKKTNRCIGTQPSTRLERILPPENLLTNWWISGSRVHTIGGIGTRLLPRSRPFQRDVR